MFRICMRVRSLTSLQARELALWWLIGNIRKLSDKEKEDLKSLCIFLGPYRNLTTLTSSLLALHPHCQVLNHAGMRVTNDDQLNFFVNYSDAKFDSFCKFAFFASQRGLRGQYGGSILLSHAFDTPYLVRQFYNNRYGARKIKRSITCLVWKESQLVSNFLKEKQVDLGLLFGENTKLRFVLPIRNPLDCAISLSNKPGYHDTIFGFKGLSDYSVDTILDAIFKEYLWILGLEEQHPDRFLIFFQQDLTKDLLVRLANFCQLEPEERWLRESLQCIGLKEGYAYKSEWIETYHELSHLYFSNYPDFLERLRLVIDT